MEKNRDDFTEIQLRHQQEMREKREAVKAVKARKSRTHRLIVRGAIAENAIEGSETMTDEQFQETILRLASYSRAIASSHPQDSLRRASRESSSEDTCGSNPR